MCAQIQEHYNLPSTYFVPEFFFFALYAIISFNDGGYLNANLNSHMSFLLIFRIAVYDI